MQTLVRFAIIALACAPAAHALAAEAPRVSRDVVYASVGGRPLALDLYMPADVRRPLLLVHLHGGAWSAGDKTQMPSFFIEHGFAVASLDFRSSKEARFPANVHDIKAAIRFLRARAGDYGYRGERIGVFGSSSGGHLAALIAVTSGHPELEGTIGEHLSASSSVQAAISYVGASDLTTILAQSTPEGLKLREPALLLLLGNYPEEVPALARLASPVFHVDAKDPPMLVFHGDQDTRIPVNQALELDWAYREAGLKLDLAILHGVDHVAEPFFTGEPVQRAVRFFQTNLGK
jgi:acetyl esterase/lipase